MKEVKLNKLLLIVAFIVYILIIVWIIGFKCNVESLLENIKYLRSLSIKEKFIDRCIPFLRFITDEKNFFIYFKHHLLNIIIYIPLGLYLMFFFKNKNIPLLIIFFSSVTFEVIQLFTGVGGYDSTDIVCNTLGGIVGIYLYQKLRIKISDKVVNIINIIVICIFLPIAIYAIINTILNINLYKG